MRSVLVGIGLLARAANSEPYPRELVDRPINLNSGMTELDVGEQFRSTVDKSLSQRTPDIRIQHAFGALQLAADLGELGVVSANLDTRSVIGVIHVSQAFGATQLDGYKHEGQNLAVEQKLHLIPGRLAAFFEVGESLNENRESGVWTHVVATFASAQGEVQVAPWLAVTGFATVSVPVVQSTGQGFVSSLDAGVSALIALGTWDISAGFTIGDVSKYRLPFLSVGFAKHWGR